MPFTIFTFDPHPSVVLKPGIVRHPLTTWTQRRELLARFNPDVLLVMAPQPQFLSLTPEAFLKEIVRGESSGIGATVMVEGPTFNFGRGAKGNVETLRALGPALGFETIVVPTQEVTLTDLSRVNVSSSVIRWLIGEGRVADAGRALGRAYALQGMVVEGAKRGRAIGFPTANLKTTQLVPAAGVYAGQARVDGRVFRAAISIGDNPTFAGSAHTVEAFLLDFSEDLYGKTIDVSFQRWVREMYAFGSAGALVRQMERDVEWTRHMVDE
jgi:riboflavin kinase/FMN adenylyltransferase